eukprot:13794042-Alexandrium_andersonii.AAC.1
MPWLVEHAGELLTRRLVGHDGRAAFERLFGKACRDDGYKFGEQGHYRVRPDDMDRSLPEPAMGVGHVAGAPLRYGLAYRGCECPRGA